MVGSLDKHIPNEKELTRQRRLCLRRELPEPGAQNFACGANCPYQALKGGYFVFLLCCQTSQASPGVQLSYLEFSPSCLVPFRLVFPFLRLRSGGLEIQFSLEAPFHPLIRL